MGGAGEMESSDGAEVEAGPSLRAASVIPAEPGIVATGFTADFEENAIHFHVLKFPRDTVFVWCGDGPPRLDHLALAIQTKWDPMPSATTVFGKDDNEWVEAFASKLAKRLKTVLYL